VQLSTFSSLLKLPGSRGLSSRLFAFRAHAHRDTAMERAHKQSRDFLRLVVDRDSPDTRIRGVYLVTDQSERLPEKVREAIAGGVSVVQYRTKSRNAGERLAVGIEVRNVCGHAGIPFIVNDDLELARELDADGLHLGQEDGSPGEARRVLGPRKIIGVSTHNLEEALQAEAAGADYIGFGAMFPTTSKQVMHQPGPTMLAAIRRHVRIPVVAIGGITRNNAAEVIDAGADAIAVISAVLGNRDPGLAAAELALLFNRLNPFPRGTVLSIAGSDSGGGAGVQADIKTATLLGSYAASVVTALTAQNTRGVLAIHTPPVEFLEEQLDAVLSDIPVSVIKTGMLYSAAIIGMVADKIRESGRRLVVVDPVMKAKGGTSLIDKDSVVALKNSLFPVTYLLTPNIPEAEKLVGCSISNERDMEAAARVLWRTGARNVLIKGGHLPAGESVDILFDGNAFYRFPAPRLLTKNTHGTGCTFASAIATFLAQGEPLPRAIERAKEFITSAIRLAVPLGKGHGPVNHYLAAKMTAD
jgi:hydroxymethylpyrimidine kinase / phosphomethylpyrimidine kinase / thiamine-phosphate diphosphorylase